MSVLRPDNRPEEIVAAYLRELEIHLEAVRKGEAEYMFEIRDFAELLHIHPRHLSNTIREVLHCSPCDIFEKRLMEIAKDMIANSDDSIASIARHLTFDPSNFNKFFKRFEGVTPNQYRVWVKNSEAITTLV
ncbi:Helix-turn-helix domain-containing protein [Flexibacter flexilis DSM 6793]|uniref:Helix-turn-helix domain-containing protein n=1 Tax=Flexibacter flexilis DSM 6793 TaxID=927664 RepID=A0A1I1M0G5_9BACT|nr:helix-turn-helix transcriptional regulator [Flexibacter flexilis]SFC75180.1 Helix-turn-helix domain-containing protein [Flexibacter flexilis DSM 6793]